MSGCRSLGVKDGCPERVRYSCCVSFDVKIRAVLDPAFTITDLPGADFALDQVEMFWGKQECGARQNHKDIRLVCSMKECGRWDISYGKVEFGSRRKYHPMTTTKRYTAVIVKPIIQSC